MAKTRPGLVVYRSELIMSCDETILAFCILVCLLFTGFETSQVARAQEGPPTNRDRDTSQPVTEVAPETTVPDEAELTKLAEVRDQGILTEEEYEAKKKQLLGL